MPVLAAQPGFNLFSSPPSNSRLNEPDSAKPPCPPIPIPKYPPKTTKTSYSPSKPPNPSQNRALKSVHRRTKYYKPVSDGVVAIEGDRSVIIGESGVSYLLPGAPFEFQFSYSETPKVKPLAIREPAHLPFAPPSMPRPWTGKAPLKKSKKNIPLFDSFNPLPPGTKGVKQVAMPGPFPLGRFPKEGKMREEILGEPLTKAEIRLLVKPFLSHNRQVNLGRDGLTHNMLELIHAHWKRQRVCKVRCLGVPTVDMDNVCHHLEDKTGGKIIHRVGGVVYIFRGRNYNYRTHPQYPIMLWKPAAPVYPKLIQDAPVGLTKSEADELRSKGQKLLPICKLAKNGVYINLVKDVRDAFGGSPLVKINCQGLDASDYKKIGAKLKDLVPCVLLSFDEEQILMWRGKEWKSMYAEDTPSVSESLPSSNGISSSSNGSDGISVAKAKTASRRIILLWEKAIQSGNAMVLDELDLGPDALLEKVEEFERLFQGMESSSRATVLLESKPAENGIEMDGGGGDDDYDGSNDDFDDDDDDDDLLEEVGPIPLGLLPVDSLAKRLGSG